MSIHDEQFREKQIIKGAKSHLMPESVTNVEIAEETVPVGDIADAAITADKIAASCFGNGMAGGAGSAMYIDVDASSVAIAANKVNLGAAGITYAMLNADVLGNGVTAGASGVDIDYDDSTINVDGSDDLQVKDAGLPKAKMAGDAKRHSISFPLPAFAPNDTVRVGLLVVPTGISFQIVLASLAAYTVPIDGDGICTVRLVNYDVSVTTADEVIAAWNAEGLVANTGTALTVITAGTVNVLEETDFLYVELTNDSAVIDTPWVGGVLTVEYEEI